MIIAELSGKIPSKFYFKEDILTSNVFSFFKYADRQILKDYLFSLGINVSLSDAKNAEFIFWPTLDDGTEPDLIIICGKYYLLFEAKLYSDFSPKSLTANSQIDREISIGKLSANNINKEFVYIVVTAEYYKDINKYSKYEKNDFLFVWTNWQTITKFIENKLFQNKIKKDKEFANDLYLLLVKKRLRSFKGLIDIKLQNNIYLNKYIFYNKKSSRFKGEFSGFLDVLTELYQIKPYQKFFQKSFFTSLSMFESYFKGEIFYHGK